jgi:DNA-binding NarL/FixJ family response regulator
MRSVLLIDDQRDQRRRLATALLERGCAVRIVGSDLSEVDLITIPCEVVVINLAGSPLGGRLALDQVLAQTTPRMTIVIDQHAGAFTDQRLFDQGVILVTAHPEVESRIGALIAPDAPTPPPPERAPSPPADELASLSPRQQSIIAGVMAGHPNKRIAADVGMSEQSVKNILTLLYRSYRVRNRVSLINAISKRTLQQ